MKNLKSLKENESYLKRVLKRKISVSESTVVAFLIAGFFGLSVGLNAAWLALDTGKGTVGAAGGTSTYDGEENKFGNIILARNGAGTWEGPVNTSNNNVKNTKQAVVIGAGNRIKTEGAEVTVIGYNARGMGFGTTAVGFSAKSEKERATAFGHNARAVDGQATAVGSNAYAKSQATAIGNDVFASGNSSIAIGNDDIASEYEDKLPEETLV